MGHLEVRLNHISDPDWVEQFRFDLLHEFIAAFDPRRNQLCKVVDDKSKDEDNQSNSKNPQTQRQILRKNITFLKLDILLTLFFFKYFLSKVRKKGVRNLVDNIL